MPDEAATPETSTSARAAAPARLASIDAYRGFVMMLLLGEALRLCAVAEKRVGSVFWEFLCDNQSHVPWVGASLHDLIQPSFSFLVGVALPFSLARRTAAGESTARMALHAFWRAFLLVVLGIALRSVHRTQTHFTFEDTLSQIGLGYGFLFLLALRPPKVQWGALFAILVGYWAAFALYPLPGPGFNHAAVGVPWNWPYNLQGFAAHWNLNSNLAWAFDTWFLNLFPREAPFAFNGGGYSTLSFIPTLGTMILGLLAGEVLGDERRTPEGRVRWLTAWGIAGMLSGYLLDALGLCPLVKRIWTPSFTLWSGGVCFLLLAAAYQAIDIWGRRRWAFPLVVVGMNSIAAYCLHELLVPFVQRALVTHLGAGPFGVFGEPYRPLLLGAAGIAVFWLVLLWMYRRRIFLRL
jgi:predicted acyltransferase